MKLTELHVEGYRSLVNVTLPMRDLMVVIGPNGSGKTALLETLHLIRYIVNQSVSEFYDVFGGIESILSLTRPPRAKFRLAISGMKNNMIFKYEFSVERQARGYGRPYERLAYFNTNDSVQPIAAFEINNDELITSYNNDQRNVIGNIAPSKATLLSLLRRYENEEEQEGVPILFAEIDNVQLFSYLDVGQRSIIRLPQSLSPTQFPGPNGENLFATLYNLQMDNGNEYQRIEDVLTQAFPGFQKLTFPAVGGGQITMRWHQKDLIAPLYPNQLSEGMLRFLWLSTILLNPNPPPIILLDEPEVSLHPQLILLLASLLQDASARCQVVVATHSPELIRWLKPENIVVADKDESGATTLTWADQLGIDYDTWLKEFTLSDMWLMGALGGRT